MANTKVKYDNYILIQGFMVSEMGLKGNELLIYAIIYGFSQLQGQHFNGSLQYLADWTNSTKQGVIKCLKSLIGKGYIVKHEDTVNGVKSCYYVLSNNDNSEEKEPSSKDIKQSLTGYSTKFNGVLNKVEWGIKQSLPNNIDNNIDNILDNNINNNINSKTGVLNEDKSSFADKDIKHKYGEFKNVLLTDKEILKLKDKFIDYEKRIDDLSYYLSSTGKKYKSHYSTILSWDRMNKEKEKPKNDNGNNADNDYFKELERKLGI